MGLYKVVGWTKSTETFTSKKSNKGVYYNPYFTINDLDRAGPLISRIIIMRQYNIGLSNITSQKTIIGPFRTQ